MGSRKMSMAEKDFLEYLDRIKALFQDGAEKELDLTLIEEVKVKGLECLYIFDLAQNKVAFHRGFKEMYGHSEARIDLPFILDKYHPEDAVVVKALVKSCLDQVLNSSVPDNTELMRIVYRFKNAKGEYRNILSNTVAYRSNKDGVIQSFLIKYTDLNFLKTSDVVEWWVNDKYLDKERMLKEVYGDRSRVFTQRELEVIREMILGKTNAQMAAALNISEHTVSTHRKNIFSKASCNEAVALYKFCKQNGILINLEQAI